MAVRPVSPLASKAGPVLTEEECLDEVMRLRVGQSPCTACGSGSGYARESRNRAFSCRSCGMKVFPCQGTAFARPRIALTQWFLAIDLAARGERSPRALRRRLGVDGATAQDLAAGVSRLKAATDPGVTARWIPEIAAFVAARRSDSDAPAPAGAPASDRETLWETVRSVLALPELEHRPALGLAAIGAFMLAGAGFGWLLVPQAPEPDEELAQSTAILSLAEAKPVILVTPDVAAQLYDVTDVDADPASPLASSIRVAPTLGAEGAAAPLATAVPMAAPAMKLAAGVGKSLVEGDTGAVRERARDRPDLAAYTALASELDAKGPRNPDELLLFGPMKIRRYLVEKIVRASRATSVDPVLLMAIADKESSFKTEVQAATSSASGLYQFIEKTWLGVVREFGSRYGLEREARILLAGDVSGVERTRILDLRRDPYLSAVLAAEMLKRDSLRIAQRIGRNLTGGEVYLVHFLGPDGAERMIDQVTRKPDTVAADLLPRPAAANKPIFYGTGADGGSKSLSVAEVRGKFETMISLRLDRYRSVKGVSVPNTPEPPIAPAAR